MMIRRYTKADVPDLVKYLKSGLSGFHYRRIDYDDQKMEDTLMGNLRNPSFFVAVCVSDDGEIAGALCAGINAYMFSHEVYADHYCTFIREEFRSLRAITGLVSAYVKWAKSKGAKQIRWEQSTGYKMEKFGILAKRLGFTQIGTKWNMELAG